MSLEMWSPVKKYSNGDSLDAETLNVPIGQLGDRTAYLYARLRELTNGKTMSSVILTNVRLSTETGKEPSVGNAVYFEQKSQTFAVAKATMSLYDDFTAANSAFTIGILISKDGDVGNVLAYGSMDLNPDGSPILVSDMIESGEGFRPGRYYLSANEAGRLSAHPNGPLIYVCNIDASVNPVSGGFSSGTAVVTPQFLDIGTSHVHRTAVLVARPAGTLSTAGYLPSSYDEDDPGKSLSLRFGGTWTADRKVAYTFWTDQSTANWPDGVTLKWTEDGEESEDFKAVIHAPDEEVAISNGLTARLSMPNATPTVAFAGLAEGARTWDALVFPDAGKGWLDHEPIAIAESSDVDGLKVAVRGGFGASPIGVNVAFPASTQILMLGSIVAGTTFTYGDVTYEFSSDVDSYSGDNTPVALGSTLADSALYLVGALAADNSSVKFAVFEGDGGSFSSSSGGDSSSSSSGEDACLLVMDGDAVSVDGTVIVGRTEKTASPFDVKGAVDVKLVVFDANGRVLSADAVMEDVQSYTWDTSGDVSVMIYQDTTVTVTVPTGTVATATAVDYEPDAVYDYVLGMDPQIANYWPPIPPKSAALVVNGVEMDNKDLLPDNPTVSFGKDTVHWFEDDDDRKPWPEAFERRDADIDPSLDKTEVMHWVRGFQCATGPVTSIQVKEGSPLKIYGYGTFDKANTGDLEIAADFDFKIENGGLPGYVVPKRAIGGKLKAGPIVERVIGGAGISVVSQAGCPKGQGTVVVALDDGAYRSQFTDVALENAEQAKIGMFPYIRLRGYANTITSPSAFTATMRVPTSLPSGTYELSVQASVFGEVGFTGASRQTACVKLAYNILPDYDVESGMGYSNLKTGLLKPDSERTVMIPFGHESDGGITYNGFDPVLVMTDNDSVSDEDDVVQKVLGGAIPYAPDFALQTVIPELRPGYLVGIRISRAVAQGDGIVPYTSPLGFINLAWSLAITSDSWRRASDPTTVLDGVVIKANTASGIRSAVETIGSRLGATVVNTKRS